MKRYIRANSASDSSSDVFDISTTGVSYYDTFLTEDGLQYMQEAKNLTGKVVEGTPKEYFEECAEMFDTTVDSLIDQRTDGRDAQYKKLIQQGTQFDMPYIYKEDQAQEGLHRMLAVALVYGWDCKVNWLEVEPYDINKYNEAKKAREASEYFRHGLSYIIRDAISELSDWDSAPPEHFERTFANAIEQKAQLRGNHIIDVEVEEQELRDGAKYQIYLVTFDGYDLPTCSAHPDSPWVDDMFEVNSVRDDDTDDIDAWIDSLSPEEFRALLADD